MYVLGNQRQWLCFLLSSWYCYLYADETVETATGWTVDPDVMADAAREISKADGKHAAMQEEIKELCDKKTCNTGT